MKIEICGPGCARCHATTENVEKAVKALGLKQEAEVREVRDIKVISSKGVFLTPGVVIDDVKVSEGRIPSPQEIEQWIKERKQ